MIGQIVGNYKIVQALGEGGVGMVYKGVDTMLDREVAIKVLRPELASQNSVVERFRSEAVTLAKLSHPNIATLYSLFRQGDHLFMVLEYIKGETLDQMLYRRGKIPTDEAIPYFCQALEGIYYAHKLGIVHRDIKPGNMMLAEDGILKVLDFGIARLLGTNRMTRVGNVIGTLEYMSPEQVKGLETDARSDVYGLGIMLYEMLTGKLPFESENDFELMKMQTEMLPLPPRALVSDIPVEVEEAIMKSVAKNPDDRFGSAGDFLNTFLDMGFALPNMTFGFGTMNNFKRTSRPSNPGIQNELPATPPITSPNPVSLSQSNIPIPQSQIPTEPVSIPKIEVPATLDVGEELKKLKEEAKAEVKETRFAPNNQSEIKGTRLAPTNPNEIKATRLGDSNTDNYQQYNQPQSASFLSKLTWVHYAGASGVALVFFGILGMAIVLPAIFGGGTKVVEKPANVETVKTPQVQPSTSATPEVVSQPQLQPQQPTYSQPTYSQVPSSTPNYNNANANASNNVPSNPTDNQPDKPNNPPSQNQPKQRETVKNNPPPVTKQQPKQTSPPANRQSSPSGGSKEELRNIITKPKDRTDN